MPHDLQTPPSFCQYANGPCDQVFEGTPVTRAVFLFPSHPDQIAATISHAVSLLRQKDPGPYLTWRDFQTTGQIIFCSICRKMRFTGAVVADVTTLNFNLLFEIGFAIGLGLPVIPIRDSTYERDHRHFEELGLLDTLGYADFQNSDGLATEVSARLPAVTPVAEVRAVIHRESPVYLLKAHIETEGAVRLTATLKREGLQFRAHDPLETPRLGLHEACKQVAESLGVIAHLLSTDRKGALVHNARCALVSGIAMATGKAVLLLQEGDVKQPIDYRDVVTPYRTPDDVPKRLRPFMLQVVSHMQKTQPRAVTASEKLLERLDLGDVAAENEVHTLPAYFVRTAQFSEAKRGHARIVAGRKGSGKTAILFALLDTIPSRPSHVVADLIPEGHRFTQLREAVLSHLSPGLQEHTLVAFWNYMLLCELAQRVGTSQELYWAQQDERRKRAYDHLASTYGEFGDVVEEGDFSERLVAEIRRLIDRYLDGGRPQDAGEVTRILFRGDIPKLSGAVADYLAYKAEVWILIDNLDKGWPTHGATSEDILILRALLEATRKLQRQLEAKGVSFHVLVFIRSDIYDLLQAETPDRGKDTVINVDWSDPDAFKEIVRRRIATSLDLSGAFDELWPALCATHVGTRQSFQYIVERTLMRPRDLLSFIGRAIEVAVNRGHERIEEDDLVQAEALYSEGMLMDTSLEIRDVFKGIIDPLYVFLGSSVKLAPLEVVDLLKRAGFRDEDLDRAIEVLLWFGFLGVQDASQEDPQYAHQVRYNVAKLRAPIQLGTGRFVIHPAFRSALETVDA